MILLNYAPACLLSLLHKVVSDISKFHLGRESPMAFLLW